MRWKPRTGTPRPLASAALRIEHMPYLTHLVYRARRVGAIGLPQKAIYHVPEQTADALTALATLSKTPCALRRALWDLVQHAHAQLWATGKWEHVHFLAFGSGTAEFSALGYFEDGRPPPSGG